MKANKNTRIKQMQESTDRISVATVAADAIPTNSLGRIIFVIAVVALGLVSFFVAAPWVSDPATYSGIIATLDEKRDNVLMLIGGSTLVSGVITVLPGDIGTPVAEKLADISADLGIVLGAIFLEKYLLTTLGFVACKVLIPLACAISAVAALLVGTGRRYRELFVSCALRLGLFAIVIMLVVPASVHVSNAIDATCKESMAQTLAATEEAEAVATMVADAEGDDEGRPNFIEFVQDIPGNVSAFATEAVDKAQQALSNLIEMLAVMIVTSCVIPILVLLVALWLTRTILGLNISLPASIHAPRVSHRS